MTSERSFYTIENGEKFLTKVSVAKSDMKVIKGVKYVPIILDNVRIADLLAGKKESYSARELAKGTVGLVKDAIGISRPPNSVIAARWECCMSCPVNKWGKCMDTNGCKCHISGKIRVSTSECPRSLWAKYDKTKETESKG